MEKACLIGMLVTLCLQFYEMAGYSSDSLHLVIWSASSIIVVGSVVYLARLYFATGDQSNIACIVIVVILFLTCACDAFSDYDVRQSLLLEMAILGAVCIVIVVVFLF